MFNAKFKKTRYWHISKLNHIFSFLLKTRNDVMTYWCEIEHLNKSKKQIHGVIFNKLLFSSHNKLEEQVANFYNALMFNSN